MENGNNVLLIFETKLGSKTMYKVRPYLPYSFKTNKYYHNNQMLQNYNYYYN
jgi:hypothetical protein